MLLLHSVKLAVLKRGVVDIAAVPLVFNLQPAPLPVDSVIYRRSMYCKRL